MIHCGTNIYTGSTHTDWVVSCSHTEQIHLLATLPCIQSHMRAVSLLTCQVPTCHHWAVMACHFVNMSAAQDSRMGIKTEERRLKKTPHSPCCRIDMAPSQGFLWRARHLCLRIVFNTSSTYAHTHTHTSTLQHWKLPLDFVLPCSKARRSFMWCLKVALCRHCAAV